MVLPVLPLIGAGLAAYLGGKYLSKGEDVTTTTISKKEYHIINENITETKGGLLQGIGEGFAGLGTGYGKGAQNVGAGVGSGIVPIAVIAGVAYVVAKKV